MATLSQISALSELLKPDPNEASNDDDNISSSSKVYIQTPAHIGPPKKETLTTKAIKETSNDIWTEEEVPESEQVDNDLDPRATPEYEILFKQKVAAEDMFLGMSNRNPSSACCEDLKVKIHLPDTSYSNVQLNVTDTYLDCRTVKYKLGLYFPHVVDSENGKALWDSEKYLLTVTVPMRREYDCLNFDSR